MTQEDARERWAPMIHCQPLKESRRIKNFKIKPYNISQPVRFPDLCFNKCILNWLNWIYAGFAVAFGTHCVQKDDFKMKQGNSLNLRI